MRVDVLTNRGVNHVLLRPLKKVGSVRDETVGLNVNLDGCGGLHDRVALQIVVPKYHRYRREEPARRASASRTAA
jgi:hypothetical protein